MILQPSCSESVFRLTGNLEEIKDEVLNMLDIIKVDYKDGINMKNKQDREWWESHKKRVAYQRKEISKIKNLKDFRMIVFTFTTNYETFFKPDKEDLIVATCNNIDWNDLNIIKGNDEDYHKIAGYDYYKLLCSGNGWMYVSNKEKKVSPVIFKLQYQLSLDVELDKTIKIIKKGKQFFYVGQKIEQLQIIDRKNLTADDKRIIAECDKKLVVERLK